MKKSNCLKVVISLGSLLGMAQAFTRVRHYQRTEQSADIGGASYGCALDDASTEACSGHEYCHALTAAVDDSSGSVQSRRACEEVLPHCESERSCVAT